MQCVHSYCRSYHSECSGSKQHVVGVLAQIKKEIQIQVLRVGVPTSDRSALHITAKEIRKVSSVLELHN